MNNNNHLNLEFDDLALIGGVSNIPHQKTKTNYPLA